jgi:hypothetical protein
MTELTQVIAEEFIGVDNLMFDMMDEVKDWIMNFFVNRMKNDVNSFGEFAIVLRILSPM